MLKAIYHFSGVLGGYFCWQHLCKTMPYSTVPEQLGTIGGWLMGTERKGQGYRGDKRCSGVKQSQERWGFPTRYGKAV